MSCRPELRDVLHGCKNHSQTLLTAKTHLSGLSTVLTAGTAALDSALSLPLPST